jgi:t-SNARE complex subunit (syntaxin)
MKKTGKQEESKQVELQVQLLAPNVKLDELSAECKTTLEAAQAKIDLFKRYYMQIGTPKDTRDLRQKMKAKMNSATLLVANTVKLQIEIETMKLTKSDDIEYRSKLLGRTKKEFKRVQTELTKTIESILSREKLYIENARRSTLKGAGTYDSESGSYLQANSFQQQHQQILEQFPAFQELNITEELIKEREIDIDQINTVINLMNDIVKIQATQVKEQGEQINTIIGNLTSSKQRVVNANKELKKAVQLTQNTNRASQNNCMMIALFCAFIVLIFLSGSGNNTRNTTH